jgi:hypothetical protein
LSAVTISSVIRVISASGSAEGFSAGGGLLALGGLFNGGRVVTHAKNSRALTLDSASVSTSSFVS